MATYYATTAGGNWSAAATWATASNQATGGAGTPVLGDTVILDQYAGNVTVDVSYVTCTTLDCTSGGTSNYTHTLAFNANTHLQFAGAATLSASMTLTMAGNTSFIAYNGNCSFNANGITIPSGFNFNAGSGNTFTLSSNLTISGGITTQSGSFNTANYNLTCSNITSSGNTTNTWTLGTSTITITGSGYAAVDLRNATGMAFSAANASWVFTNAGGTGWYSGPSNQTIGSVTCNVAGAFILAFSSNTTIVNFTRNGVAATTSATNQLQVNGGFIVSGVLTLAGNSIGNRLWVGSSPGQSYNTPPTGYAYTITLTSTATYSISNVDFTDVTFSGTGVPLSGTNLGDGGGNTGITFPASRTLYGMPTTSGTNVNWWSTASWSTDSSAGRASSNTVPLAHDDVVLDATTASGNWNTGATYANNGVFGRNITCVTGFTGVFGYALNNTTTFGSVTLVAGMTTNGSSTAYFSGRGNLTLTTAGVTWVGGVALVGPSSTWTLQDNFLATGRNLAIQGNNGYPMTLKTNGKNITCSAITSPGANAKTIDAGGISATWTLTGTGGGNSLNMGGNCTVSNTQNVAVVFAPATGNYVQIAGFANTPTFASLTHSPSTPVVSTFQLLSGFYTNSITIPPGTLIQTQGGQTFVVATGSGFSVQGSNWGYVRMLGSNYPSNYISAPDAAPLRLTGSMTIDCRAALVSWAGTTQSQALVSKATSGVTYGYVLMIDGGGNLRMYLYTAANGSTSYLFTSSAQPSSVFSAGATGWIRASVDLTSGTTGTCTFYTSTDGSTWTQLGTVQSQAISSANPVANTAAPVTIGTDGAGNQWQTAGNFYRARIYNSALGTGTGTPVFDCNLSLKPFGLNSMIESSPNAATVSLTGNMTQHGDGRITMQSYNSPGVWTVSVTDASPLVTDYLVLQDARTGGGGRFDAGAHSLKLGNVAGWMPAFAADINPGQPFPGVINPSLMRMATR